MANETSPDRVQLGIAAGVRFLLGLGALMALLLLAAGTAAYWQAWLFLGTLAVPVTIVVGYLLRHDPELLARRLKARERDPGQGALVGLGALSYLATFLLAGLDRRLTWSHVPAAVVFAADLAILLAYWLFVRVLRVNRYASRVVEVEAGQQVATSGPYAVVRHPMYVAVLGIFLAAPVALGSWWALPTTLPLVAVVVARIRNEERMLAQQLTGYREYMQVTRHRLIPGLW